ncbi:MAG: hypothetical protein M3138_04345 [Actinomycetota bacterium]|nr:hypothetical protein [Actinomycetota bacterium]
MKKLFLVPMLLALAIAVPALADPGPTDEVEVILGDCEDGTTILRAHNTQSVELGWLIRIDGRQVDQGRLAPDERVERTYEVPLGESHFFRIRLGLTGEGVYFSHEGTTARIDCPSPSESPPSGTPSTSSPPPGGSTTSSPPTIGGGGGTTTPSTSVLGGAGTNTPGPGGTAFTGPELGWLIAVGMGLVLLGAAALRFASSTR